MSDINMPGLIIPIEARIDRLEKSLAKAGQAQQRAARQMEAQARQNAERIGQSYARMPDGIVTAFNRLRGLAMPFAGGFLGGLAAGGVAQTVDSLRHVATEIANIGNEARRAGLGTDAFQEWANVADQNRISIDALTDGFKELSLRADEFITTGAGSAAEAFARLGFSAEDLRRRLENPSRLMLEIMRRLQGFDRAAQIRIADEVFGGTGGERFVELLGQGQAALQATINRAHETGAVLDAELIARAEETDRAFRDLTTRVENFGKRAALAIAEALVEMADFRERLDRVFPDEAQGRAILGDQLYDALNRDRDALDQNAEAAARLRERYASLTDEATTAAGSLTQAVPPLASWGYTDQAASIGTIAEAMRALVSQFEAGEISAEDFTARLSDLQAEAAQAFASLEEGDRVEFGGVISQLVRLAGVVQAVSELAATLTGRLREATGISPDQVAVRALRQRHEAEAQSMENWRAMQAASDRFAASEEHRNAQTSEQLRLEREVAAVRTRAASEGAALTNQQAEDMARAALAAEAARQAAARAGAGGGGGDGSATRADEFAREAQAIRDRTMALQIEAAVLSSSAVAHRQVGDRAAYAEGRIALLTAAQRAGVTVTPALEQQINGLADAYARAGGSADAARAGMERMQQAAVAGAGALADLFMAGLEGAGSFEQALLRLAQTILRNLVSQMLLRAFANAAPGGFMSFVGGLMGFADGGYTGDGGRLEPAGIVHKGEFVMSKAATTRLGVQRLDQLHAAALRGYSDGGLVGEGGRVSQALSEPQQARVGTGTQQISINAPVTVNATGGTQDQNRDLADQMGRAVERQMRAVVIEELRRQLRPGNMLGLARA
ncbi:hypothetical protein [Pararhodobacter aggregans]